MYLEKVQAEKKLEDYKKEIELQELSDRTVKKYLADIRQWLAVVNDNVISKETIIIYKRQLTKKYKVASVNSKIISVNCYLRWLGFSELAVCTERIQTANVLDKMITKENYFAMLNYTKKTGKSKLYHIMKTIARTGLRVGELKYVTVVAITQRDMHKFGIKGSIDMFIFLKVYVKSC